VYIKDLRIFEDQWDLKDIVLIDNSTHSFALQIENGYPILSYYDDQEDRELVVLTQYLLTLSKLDDVRPMLDQSFYMRRFLKENVIQDISGVIEYAVMEYEEDDVDQQIDQLRIEREEQ
jgi:hypothetical protein